MSISSLNYFIVVGADKLYFGCAKVRIMLLA
jgi:hypothetical protein